MPSADKALERLEDLGVNLHTALRKCCDSTSTSIIYNLVSLDEFDEVWHTYLQLVLDQESPVTVTKAKKASQLLEWGDAKRNALKCAFSLFDDDDWAGFIAFEEEEYAET